MSADGAGPEGGRASGDRAARAAVACALLAAAAAAALFAAVVALRFSHPYELEWMEGGMLAHVRRVLDGRPVYAKPDLEFVSYLYPPLYYWAGALASLVVGEGFGALRGVSVASTLAVCALLVRIAHRESGRFAGGLVAAGLLLAGYERSGAWLDLARADAFYLAWIVLAVERLRASSSTASAVQAGLAVAAAFFVKQSVAVIAAPVWLVLLAVDRRRAFAAALGAGVPIALGTLALDAAHDGWFLYYTFTVPRAHPLEPGQGAAFLTRDLLATYGFALALFGAYAAQVAARVRAHRARSAPSAPRPAGGDALFAAFLVGAAASSGSVRALVGAHTNNLLPVFAAASLCAGVAFDAFAARGGRAAVLAGAAVVAQVALLAYDPRPLVPTARDVAAGDALVARLAAIDGDVWIPNHGYLARRAGKREYAHTLAIDNLLLDDFGPARRDLEAELVRGLAERRFAAVVIESDGRYGGLAQRFYGAGAPLFAADDVFFCVSGGRIRPETLYGAGAPPPLGADTAAPSAPSR